MSHQAPVSSTGVDARLTLGWIISMRVTRELSLSLVNGFSTSELAQSTIAPILGMAEI
jgi:hypothetical protein